MNALSMDNEGSLDGVCRLLFRLLQFITFSIGNNILLVKCPVLQERVLLHLSIQGDPVQVTFPELHYEIEV